MNSSHFSAISPVHHSIKAELMSAEPEDVEKPEVENNKPNLTIVVCSNYQKEVNSPSININGEKATEIVKSLETMPPDSLQVLVDALSVLVKNNKL
jgi:hypothetical protein